jgi:hypothetical protein
MLALLLLAGCGVPGLLHEARQVANPTLAGEITIQSNGKEPITWHPDACRSGEHEQFFGFDLDAADSDAHVRAVLDPLSGPGVRLDGIGTEPIVLWQSDCALLELDVQPTGWKINEYRDLTGRLELDCTTSGRRITGRIDVQHCH